MDLNSTLEKEKQLITERYFEVINLSNIELFGRIKNNMEKIKPIYPFIEFIIERLATVTTLSIQNCLWDAEIVYRSALETFIKYMFITSANEQEQPVRLKEFWEDLAEIKSIKLSEQAKKNLKLFGDKEIGRLAFSPLLLPEEEEKRLKTKWPKIRRQQLEQKWSFSEIVIQKSMEDIHEITEKYHLKVFDDSLYDKYRI